MSKGTKVEPTANFKIERIDPFGQGVSLAPEKITFIPKTLPGESVRATIYQEKGKKVQFAEPEEIIESSPLRENPACPHFNECQGCSFLHTSYEQEINFKKEAYGFLFKNLSEEVEFVGAPHRMGYRNRIQLHYTKKGKLGFVNRQGIHEVPSCLIAQKPIQEKLKELYDESNDETYWKNLLAVRDPSEGHFELSYRDEKVEVVKNSPYSDGGFRQVFEEMAVKARDLITSFLEENESNKNLATLELFGGHGALSKNLKGPKVLCDSGLEPSELPKETNYVGMNLYGKWATAKISKVIKKKESAFPDIEGWNIIVDPPRSGLKTIDQFTQLEDLKEKTHKMAYLSCHPQGQKRDLEILLKNPKWKLEKLLFLDFFPGTHHLESLALLSYQNAD